MGMCSSGDIFQAKVENQWYRGRQNVYQWYTCFKQGHIWKTHRPAENNIWQTVGLTVNAPNCSFGLKYIT